MATASPPSDELVFFVNGRKVVERNPDPEWTLLFYLRTKLGLVGSKLGCGEGGCGACTVMVSKLTGDGISHVAVNACLCLVAALHGTAVTTVEALGKAPDRLHPVQERLVKAHGSQCGFCTPGFVMSAYALLRSQPGPPSLQQLEEALVGNLCRCTGYRPILEGLRTLTCDGGAPCRPAACCRGKSGKCHQPAGGGGGAPGGCEMVEELFDVASCAEYDPSQEPIFPPELLLAPELGRARLSFCGPRVRFEQVTSLPELLLIKHQRPEAKIIVGNTEVGVEVRTKHQLYPVLVSVAGVKEMEAVTVQEDGVVIGAAVTLTELRQRLQQVIDSLPTQRTRTLAALQELLRCFAGPQIRNVASVGGNIITSSPISDLNPLLLASSCTLQLCSHSGGTRSRVMDSTFFSGYRQCDVAVSEVLVAVVVPYTAEAEYVCGYKQARRRQDDIAIVNAGLRVRLDGDVVASASLAFGGVAPTTSLAAATAQMMLGRRWDEALLWDVMQSLVGELQVRPSAPGGMASYRTTLLPSFFFKFYLYVRDALSETVAGVPALAAHERELLRPHARPPHTATHLYERVPRAQPATDPVGRPVVHATARQHATGEATYVGDLPRYASELFGVLVLSSQARAEVVSLEVADALALPGVRAVITADDIPRERNRCGEIVLDEEVFASSGVRYVGQPLGLVVAESEAAARQAARLVRVRYQVSEKPLITLQEAIEAKSWLPPFTVHCGDVGAAHAAATHSLSGEVHIGGQEHFYLEPNAHLALPGECNSVEVFCSTQCPATMQRAIARALGVPANQVVVRTKRMGGGFGGKDTRTAMAAVPAALAASLTGRPVRVVLERWEDMLITGTRHPFFARFKASFDDAGVVRALEMDLFCNAGHSVDFSRAVMERAVLHADNTYYCPNVRVTGYVCMTNLASNTAFRGFGAPQAMLVREEVMARVASFLGVDAAGVREANLYREGDLTHFRQPLEACTIRRCWQDVTAQADLQRRRQLVTEFNSAHVYQKRGLAVVPTKFGMAFTIKFLNQAGALVMVYRDGSVLLAHGGTEMGQGLHTKMIQVASKALQIPHTKIHVSETATDKVPNASPTAASMSSDLNGQAVLRACETLRERLAPYRERLPQAGWDAWVAAAYLDRVQLCATGFYSLPNVGPFDFETQEGTPFNYFCFGAAVSEVEVDCLTGSHTVLRTDIVMDVGKSLNPAVDIGQIEGAFLQGQGLFTLEELRYSPDGELLTKGPGTYKLPGVQDIPCELNVTLLREAGNPKAVYSSKAIGEPPLFLAASVFFAIRDAVAAARSDHRFRQSGVPDSTPEDKTSAGGTGTASPPGTSIVTESADLFRLDSPATVERIRMACADRITSIVEVPQPGTYRPWDVTV